MVAHALTYWPNVGPFGPSLPQPPNLTSLRKLQYTSARTNMTHASIVAHALTCLPNVGAFGPSVPQPPNLTSLWKLQYSVDIIYSKHTLLRGWGWVPSESLSSTEPVCLCRLENTRNLILNFLF